MRLRLHVSIGKPDEGRRIILGHDPPFTLERPTLKFGVGSLQVGLLQKKTIARAPLACFLFFLLF